MKFFILGDSFGLGEWEVNSGIMELVPNTGLDFYLKQLGHSTTNASAGSASNFGQLRNAYWRLKEDSDYDYIVWFHTEPIRDIVETVIDDPNEALNQYPDFKSIKNYLTALEYINKCNYNFAQQRIYAEFQIPFIVIGGQGRIDESINNFTFAHYKIYSWTQELLKMNRNPPMNALAWQRSLEVFDHFDYNRQEVIDEIKSAEEYRNLLKLSPLFPDDTHVIRSEYEKLAHRIIKML